MAEKIENTLTTSTPALTDYVRSVSSSGNSRKATIAALAELIIEDYEGSSLGGSSQSVKSALDTLGVAITTAQIDALFE